MSWLYRYSIRHPWRVIVAGLLVSGLAAPGVTRLKLRTDGHALVPEDAPAIEVDRQVRDSFGIDDPIVILVETDHAEGIFNPHTLRLVIQLTAAATRIEGVRWETVFSLATEHTDRVFPGTLKFRRFLEPFPSTQEDLDRLREDLRQIDLYNGTLISSDAAATSVMFGVPAGTDRVVLYADLRRTIAGMPTAPDRVSVIGAPVAEAMLGTHILEDLGVPQLLLGNRTHGDVELGGSAESSWYMLRRWIARRIGLVPVAVVIMAFVFLICFRKAAAAVMPLIEVGACLAFVFGIMGWTGVPVYLTIAVLPIILTAMGIADEIHIFARFADLARDRQTASELPLDGGAGQELTLRTMDEMWRPVVKTSVTTAVGFLSFALSPIAAVRAFGIFTAIGIVFCMFWSLSVVPAMVALAGPRRLVRLGRRSGPGGAPGGRFRAMGHAVIASRWLVLLVGIGVLAAAPLGARRVVVQDSWIDGFAPESPFRRATERFNERFLGTHILQVRLDVDTSDAIVGVLPAKLMERTRLKLPLSAVSDPNTLTDSWIKLNRVTPERVPHGPASGQSFDWNSRIEAAGVEGNHIVVRFSSRMGSPRPRLRLMIDEDAAYEIRRFPFRETATLQRVDAFEQFVASQTADAVGGVIGPAAYIKTTNFMARARREEERAIPDNGERIEWLWSQFDRIRKAERRRMIVNDDQSSGIVTILMKDANFVDTAHLMSTIRDYEAQHLTPHGIHVSFAGDVAVSQTLIDAIVSTQLRSLIGSLVGILIVTTIMSRSLVWGFLSVLPCAIAVLINFAVMGIASIPLGVATSMFAGMTLGIGVDYAIHLLERYRFALRQGLPVDAALMEASGTTGPAIVIDGLAVALGFGVMTLSQVPANARLGALVVLSIAGCLASTLAILPALIRVIRLR